MAIWKVFLFGTPRLERDGARVVLARRKQWALFAYLLLSPQAHGRDALATLLWPRFDQHDARSDLRRDLSRLRRVLGDLVVCEGNEVALGNRQRLWLDVDEFAAHLAAVQRHAGCAGVHCTTCREHLLAAQRLYLGDFMAGFTLRDSQGFDDWQFTVEEALRSNLLEVLRRLTAMSLAAAEWTAAIAWLRQHVAIDPYDETSHRQLMELYARTGQRAAAIHQFHMCEHILAAELHTTPAPETAALFHQIATADTSVLVPASVMVGVTQPLYEGSMLSADRGFDSPCFVGRSRQLAKLHEHLEVALGGGCGHAVFVTGTTGTGKTALLREFGSRALAAHSELIVAEGCGTTLDSAGAAYVPFRDLLGMLLGDFEGLCTDEAPCDEQRSRLLAFAPQVSEVLANFGTDLVSLLALDDRRWRHPRLADSVSLADQGATAGQTTLQPAFAALEHRVSAEYGAFLHALAARRPLLLLFDNLQWFDRTSLSLLFHLSKRLAGSPVLLLGAYRSHEVPGGYGLLHSAAENATPYLAMLLDETARDFGDVTIDLDMTSAAEDREWMDALLDSAPHLFSSGFRHALYAAASGHPLFTVELLRLFQERGWLQRDAEGAWHVMVPVEWDSVPARVAGAIQGRLVSLSDEAHSLLRVASLAGDSFTAESVARVQGVDERVALHLFAEELHRRSRLVVEQDVGADSLITGYRFANPMIRTWLLSQMDCSEKALLSAAFEQVRAQDVRLP